MTRRTDKEIFEPYMVGKDYIQDYSLAINGLNTECLLAISIKGEGYREQSWAVMKKHLLRSPDRYFTCVKWVGNENEIRERVEEYGSFDEAKRRLVKRVTEIIGNGWIICQSLCTE